MVSIRYWAAIYGLSGTYFKGTRILGLTHISYSASMSMLWFDTLFVVILWPLNIPLKLTDSELFILLKDKLLCPKNGVGGIGLNGIKVI